MENNTALQHIQSISHSDQETLVLHCSNPNIKRDREEGETVSIEDLRQKNRDLLAKIQRLEGKLSAVEDNLKCNICLENSEDDVLLKCGHNFCRPCLTSWSGTGRTAGRTCSLCREPTSEANQSEHLAFRRVVEAVKYTKVYPNGEKYIGDLEGEKRHGQGVCFYPNGNKYEGGWREDSMFGQGVYTWKDGSFYEGDWQDNEMHGQGVKILANGERCEGSWKKGKRDGRGVMKRDKKIRGVEYSEKYDGEWKDDKKHGHGIYTDDITNSRYEGQWQNNHHHGRGTLTWGRDSNSVYDGEWKDGTYHGSGTLTYHDEGRKWEGQFVKGYMHGQIRFTSSKGDIYTGEYHNGSMEGLGVIEYANGDKYEGLFHEGQRQGKGKMTLASGVEEDGLWYDDEKLPDPSTLNANELILLFVGMTPDFSKPFLIDAFRGRIVKNDDMRLSEAGDLAEVIVEQYKLHEIVAMLRDENAFEEGIEYADGFLEALEEVENDFEGDIPNVPNITVKDRIKRAENKFLGKEFPEHTLGERVAKLKDFLEH